MKSVYLIGAARGDKSPMEPVRLAVEAHAGLDVWHATGEEYADVAVILGDRSEALTEVHRASMRGSVIVHLHGGEVTKGSQDNRWRYAISAIADVHCPATYRSRDRLIAHGEQPERIHVTGAPGLDRLAGALLYERGTHGIPEAPFVLCTVHPATGDRKRESTTDVMHAVFDAVEAVGMPVVWTAPNRDGEWTYIAGLIRDAIQGVPADYDMPACESHPHWTYHEDAGTQLYLSLMHHAAVMVGNSSSGIIEAPEFGLPVVNVGRRQEGRERGGYIEDARVDSRHIEEKIRYFVRWSGPYGLPSIPNPYRPHGDYKASERIADIIAGLDLDEYKEKTYAR